MKTFLSHQNRRFGNAIKGFCSAYKSDLNFKLEVWSSLFFLGFGYFMWPLSQTEILFLTLSYALILITELQNTSFEKALDRLHPELHDDIGASKDIAASAVLIAGLFALVVVLLILTNHFGVTV